MCAWITIMYLPSRVRRASHRGSKNWRRKVAISFCRSHTRDSMALRLSQWTSQLGVLHCDLINQCLELITGRRNLQHDSRLGPTCLVLVRTFTRRIMSFMTPAFFGWGFAGRTAMVLPSRVAGRTLGPRGPELARGPEVARPWSTPSLIFLHYGFYFTNPDDVLMCPYWP